MPMIPMRTPKQKYDAFMKRRSQLEAERSSWDAHWSVLGRHILPRSGRFSTSNRNRAGQHHYGDILDNTATRSSRVLRAGLMTWFTSPARPWFRLTPQNPDLREFYDVRVWLDEVVERMQMVFARSNFYRVLPKIYEELSVFGTSAMLVLPDFDTVIRCYPMAVGQYSLQQDYQGRITTVYREFQRTVGEVVKEFGFENCSERVQSSFNNRELDSPVDLLHVIEPREDQERDLDSPLATDMPWRSAYLELGGQVDKLLRESGFERSPLVAPRWQVSGEDVYGISPAMEALGDIKQLQQQQFRKSQAIDYKTKPPLQVPQSLKDRTHDGLPGGLSYFEPGTTLPFDQVTPNGGIRTAFEVQLPLDELLVDIQDVRHRISKAFYEDLFLMLASAGPDHRMTATEVLERHEEKLLMIGPVLEQLDNELLNPVIDIAFQQMFRVGMIPPPPQELLGEELSVELVSALAQAQRAVGIAGMQQFTADIISAAQVRPDVLDRVNWDKWVEQMAFMRGIETEVIADDESVQILREARAAAEAAREQVAVGREQAETAKALASAPVEQNTALDQLIRQTQGAA